MHPQEIVKVNHQIANRIKKIRKNQALTLDELAELSGVSKSMLGQIERAQSSPSITTLIKITEALQVPLTGVIEEEGQGIKLVRSNKMTPLIGRMRDSRLYPTFPFDNLRKFEMFYGEIDPHSRVDTEPTNNNTYEYIILFSGELEVVIDGRSYFLTEGDGIKYRADVKRAYVNSTDEEARMTFLIYYEWK